MSKRKPFLLRVDPRVHDALRRWAEDELRSLNGQAEVILREALRRAGRLPSGQEELAARPEAVEPEPEAATEPSQSTEAQEASEPPVEAQDPEAENGPS